MKLKNKRVHYLVTYRYQTDNVLFSKPITVVFFADGRDADDIMKIFNRQLFKKVNEDDWGPEYSLKENALIITGASIIGYEDIKV